MNLAAATSFMSESAGATHLIPGGWIQLAIADAASDELAGDVGLFLSQDCTFAELGFTLARSEQGKGHATRAAELAVEQVLRFQSVVNVRAVTDQLNHASVAVLRRLGFAQTGRRKAIFKGKACSELALAKGRHED
jgi:aminoglycoside 6'-N-acetyltransferase